MTTVTHGTGFGCDSDSYNHDVQHEDDKVTGDTEITDLGRGQFNTMHSLHFTSLQEGLHDGFHVQLLQVRVGLTTADEHDWSSRYVDHGKRCSNLHFFFSYIRIPHKEIPLDITRTSVQALTLSSMVSNLVSRIPSINLLVGTADRSANFCLTNQVQKTLSTRNQIPLNKHHSKDNIHLSLKCKLLYLVKFSELIHSIISNQCFSNK